MNPTKVRVTRDVSNNEDHNYYGQQVIKGAEFWTFTKPTYGCVDEVEGIALSEMAGIYPFFEFPRDAVEPIETGVNGDQL